VKCIEYLRSTILRHRCEHSDARYLSLMLRLNCERGGKQAEPKQAERYAFRLAHRRSTGSVCKSTDCGIMSCDAATVAHDLSR
jgi:hypothetical protein